jgi:C-terminal processing protease CtpA/Prc
MPTGISLQVPTGRIVLPDGSLFLEGTGVPPTVKVPVDVQSLTSGQDVVLQKAESIILGK